MVVVNLGFYITGRFFWGSMNYFDFLTDAVEFRLLQVQQEVSLIRKQISAFDLVAGIKDQQVNVVICRNNILMLYHDLLKTYLTEMIQRRLESCPLKGAVSCHLAALIAQKDSIETILEEIEKQQSHLFEIINPGQKDVEQQKRGDGLNDLMLYLARYFPFRKVYELCLNTKFFYELLRIASNCNVKDVAGYKQKLKELFWEMRRDPSVFGEDLVLTVSIAEVLLGFFLAKDMMAVDVDEQAGFQFWVTSGWLLDNNLAGLKIEKSTIESVKRTGGERVLDKMNDGQCEYGSESPKFCCFDDSHEPVIPELGHVVLELRKLTTQCSVTTMTYCLWQAMEYLSATLGADCESVGSDESFQFFVAAVTEAHFLIAPTLLRMLQDLMIDDLKTSFKSFLVARLSVAEDFIKTRRAPGPPLLLMPRGVRKFELCADDTSAVEFKGLIMYAVPSYQKSPYPIVFSFTGNAYDVVSVCKYQNCLTQPITADFEEMPTVHGFLPFIANKAIKSSLIRIDQLHSDHSVSMTDVFAVSDLLVMSQTKLMYPRLSDKQNLASVYRRKWRETDKWRDLRGKILTHVKDIQTALIARGALNKDHEVDGVLDSDTVDAVKAVVQFKNDEFFLDPRIKSFICS